MDFERITASLEDALVYAKEGVYEKAIELLTSDEIGITKLVNYYVNAYKYHYTDNPVYIMGLIIKILQEIYNNSDIPSPIPDEVYDKLYGVYLSKSGSNIVGAEGHSPDRIVSNHKYPKLRGTLDKIHFITNSEKREGEKRKSLEDWIKSIETKLGKPADDAVVVLFPKWDGISAIFECDENGKVLKVLKRGDTTRNEAEEITKLFEGTNMLTVVNPANYAKITDVNLKPFGVKTEIVMPRDMYELLCKKFGDFKSPRSAVSSIINSKELDQKYLPYLTVIPLQVEIEGKVSTAKSSIEDFPIKTAMLKDFNEVSDAIKKLRTKVNKEFGIDIDGIVIRILNLKFVDKLGREDNINKYEVAYKFPPDQKKSVIKAVEMSVGLFGTITPVAKIKPVKMKGNTISSISLGSIERFKTLDLAFNDEVIIKYDVIPYLEVDETCKRSNNSKFEVPTHCPYCNHELVYDPVLKCINMFCDTRVIGKILNYVTKMDIPNLSVGIISTLYNHNILKSVGDLYRLKDKRSQIVEIDGFGNKLVDNILDGINSRTDVFDYELIGSIGIPDIGRRIFKKVLDVYPLKELMDIARDKDVAKLSKIRGIQQKTATKIIEGLLSNEFLIEDLMGILNVKKDNLVYKAKVVFTKVRDEEFAKFLEKNQILVLDSFTKDADFLIVPDYNTESSKVTKARKLGKAILSIKDAYRLFNYKV